MWCGCGAGMWCRDVVQGCGVEMVALVVQWPECVMNLFSIFFNIYRHVPTGLLRFFTNGIAYDGQPFIFDFNVCLTNINI